MPPTEPDTTKKKPGDTVAARPAPAASPAPTVTQPAHDIAPAPAPPPAVRAPDDLESAVRRKLSSLEDLEDELRAKMRVLDERLELQAQAPAPTVQVDAPAKPAADAGPGKLLGHVPVYANDGAQAILDRAIALRRGHIPVHMAKRFRTKARINAIMGNAIMGESGWPLAKRIKEPALPLGFEFDADEMPMEERAAFFEVGAIEAIE